MNVQICGLRREGGFINFPVEKNKNIKNKERIHQDRDL